MSAFGEAAVEAAKSAGGGAMSPNDAWRKSTAKMTQAMREKSCPRCAFLGLCEKGYVEGIGPGRYSAREIKKKYAVDAVDLLRKDRRVARDIELHADDTKLLATDIMNLWKKIVPVTKKHNQQMHVVVALWNKKLIKAT